VRRAANCISNQLKHAVVRQTERLNVRDSVASMENQNSQLVQHQAAMLRAFNSVGGEGSGSEKNSWKPRPAPVVQ
jgi:hypothetical protein